MRLLVAAGSALPAKIGLTSRAKQAQMGVAEPLYGELTDAMLLDVGEPLDTARLIQPQVEPEIAFLLGADLAGERVGAAQVLAATAAVAPAIEVIDSRYAGYAFTLPDVVADSASAARLVLGGVRQAVDGIDLRLIGCVLELGGQVRGDRRRGGLPRPPRRGRGLAGPGPPPPGPRPGRRGRGPVGRAHRGGAGGARRRGRGPPGPARGPWSWPSADPDREDPCPSSASTWSAAVTRRC